MDFFTLLYWLVVLQATAVIVLVVGVIILVVMLYCAWSE